MTPTQHLEVMSTAPTGPSEGTATLELPEMDQLPDTPWITLVWNDPVNLMSYVTYVFQTYFGYSKDKATALMLDVHHKGRAVVATGPREQMERHVEALQSYGLWATFQKDE